MASYDDLGFQPVAATASAPASHDDLGFVPGTPEPEPSWITKFKRFVSADPKQNVFPVPGLSDSSMVTRALNYPFQGLDQAAHGMAEMTQPGQRVRGASDILRGGMKAGTVMLPQAAVAAPLATAMGIGTGMAASGAASGIAGALGAPQDVQDLTGDVAGLAAGGMAAGRAGAIKDAAGAMMPDLVKGDPTRLTVQALKPRNTDLGFSKVVPKALSEIKQSAIDTGTPIKGNSDFGVDDYLNLISDAKKRVWGQYQQYLGPKASWNVDLTPAADAADAMITKKMQVEDPQSVAAQQQANDVYRNQFSVQDAEKLLRDTNASLDSYYSKLPRGQYSALKNNPDTASDYAKADAIRQILYGALDEEGNGAVPKDLMQRYGALSKLEMAAQSRKNVAERQQPDNLVQQYSNVVAAMKIMQATGRMLTTHDLLGAGMDVAEAAAAKGAASWVKNQNTTNALLRRSLLSHDQLPDPVPAPPPTNISGLLGPAPIVTPPPADTSGPTGAQPYMGRGMSPNTGQRTLGGASPGIKRPIVTPPPPNSFPGQGPSGAIPFVTPVTENTARMLPQASGVPVKQPGFAVQDMVALRDPMTGRVTYISRQDLRDLQNLKSPEAK